MFLMAFSLSSSIYILAHYVLHAPSRVLHAIFTGKIRDKASWQLRTSEEVASEAHGPRHYISNPRIQNGSRAMILCC
ncbi:hypothetical protein EDD16DRAFT_1532181 [Pisolithus croceorrhizus]|nr:hypothetical protein EV401DRAFT_1920692 [Pisolithus croceorrhizus]KAI6132464.1 hypothetical protein EDD16DRAFT_1532181 [Pisolithus croceorrhizus]KAI6168789.1 hypothetical protein EDD17DRAFT_1530184 [Pisolithus thermaeus]